MQFDIFASSIVGARDNQEDSFSCSRYNGGQEALVIVADGMGGHEGGEIASTLAVRAFTEHFDKYTQGPIPKRLEIALIMANQALAERIRQDLELDGMGTTLLAVYTDISRVYWASVGDSPLILVRDAMALRLNEDHSTAPIIERQVLAGKITRKQADCHPDRGALLSCLSGLYSPDMIDCPAGPYALRSGDCIIVASDGLLTLSLADLAGVVLPGEDSERIAQRIMGAIDARQLPEQDNATVQVIVVR